MISRGQQALPGKSQTEQIGKNTKIMFVPKVLLLPLFYLFVNLNLTDKHGTKTFCRLICPWAPFAFPKNKQ